MMNKLLGIFLLSILVTSSHGHGVAIPSIHSVNAITISIDVDQKPSLFIMLVDDGSVKRMGRGSIDNDEYDLYVGLIDSGAFLELRSMVTEDWFSAQGRYEYPNRIGPEVELSIILHLNDGADIGLQFLHGLESEKPPGEVINLVRKAVELTAEWTREMKAMAEAKKP